MANEQNLVQNSGRTRKEVEELNRKGGIKSGEVRRARKTLKEELLLLLENKDTQKNLTIALLDKAMSGDTKAYEVIRDTIGEKPIDKVETEVVSTIKVDVVDE